MSSRSVFISISTFSFFLMTTSVFAITDVLELRTENAASHAAVKEALKQQRAEVRTTAKQRWEELKTMREASREAKRSEVKAIVQAKQEDMKAKMSAMRDERKKQIVERVQTKLAEVNARRVDHFLKALDRLLTVLDKIQSRSEKAKTEGKNVTAIEAALASARTAVSTAQSAVNAQQVKTYQITVNGDTTARSDVGVATKQLQQDLQSVYDTVKAARDAVQHVFEQMKIVAGSSAIVPGVPTATNSSLKK